MYRIFGRLALAVVVTCTLAAAPATARPARRTWMLQRADGTWRIFKSKARWQRAAKAVRPLETAAVTRTAKTISVVYDVQGESGDWRNIDRYVFKSNGILVKLDRTFASVSQDIKLTQTYKLDPSGKLRSESQREVSLATGKAKSEAPDVPQLAVATRISQLHFMKRSRRHRSAGPSGAHRP